MKKYSVLDLKYTILVLFCGLFILVSCFKKEEPLEGNAVPYISENKATVVPKLSPLEEGKSLVEGADCLTCHKTDSKLIGPSYQEIATKYKETDTDLLADKIVNGGSGVWGDIPMAAHPGMDKENAKKMVKYILSLKK
jgi:cytochrome c